MYTGIVQETCQIVKLVKNPGCYQITVEFPNRLCQDLEIGASVALNGVCFTVRELTNNQVRFDAIESTLKTTTMSALKEGDWVNVERSMRMGAEIGGHILSGHVRTKAQLVKIDRYPGNHVLTFQVGKEYFKYIFEKGFLAIHGCSLTVSDVQEKEAQFKVYLIPETLERTNLESLQVGDEVNIEIDPQTQMVVDTIERMVARGTFELKPKAL